MKYSPELAYPNTDISDRYDGIRDLLSDIVANIEKSDLK